MTKRMKLERIVQWLDKTLNVAAFDDVSNNGVQLGREGSAASGGEVTKVAFAVDASVASVKAAAKAGAQLLVVHHGISWGGGIRRIEGGVYNVVRAAMEANLAIYACHLPLDAHPTLGNNACLAKILKLKDVRPAFSYHGNVIGLVGRGSPARLSRLVPRLSFSAPGASVVTIGVCSGGAGEFAEEAKRLGCDIYLTGEANWGEVVAAANCGMTMVCGGHYETEVHGVRAVSKALRRALKVKTVDLTKEKNENE